MKLSLGTRALSVAGAMMAVLGASLTIPTAAEAAPVVAVFNLTVVRPDASTYATGIAPDDGARSDIAPTAAEGPKVTVGVGDAVRVALTCVGTSTACSPVRPVTVWRYDWTESHWVVFARTNIGQLNSALTTASLITPDTSAPTLPGKSWAFSVTADEWSRQPAVPDSRAHWATVSVRKATPVTVTSADSRIRVVTIGASHGILAIPGLNATARVRFTITTGFAGRTGTLVSQVGQSRITTPVTFKQGRAVFDLAVGTHTLYINPIPSIVPPTTAPKSFAGVTIPVQVIS